MKGLKHNVLSFLRTVRQSLMDIRFYRGVMHKHPGEAAGYLALLISAAWLVPFLTVFFIGTHQSLSGFLTVFDRSIPSGTSFELKKGVFTNSLKAPVTLDWGGLQVAINTATSTLGTATGTVGIAILHESLVAPAQDDAPPQVLPFSKFPDFSATKEQLQQRFRADAPWFIAFLALIGLCVVAFFGALVLAVMTLSHALLFWLLLRALKKPLRYAEAWTLAAYAITPFVIAKAILSLAGVGDNGLSSLLYWVLLAFIAYDFWKGKPSSETTKEV